MKCVNRYIPVIAFNALQAKLKTNPPEIKRFEKEVFYFILDCFYRIKANNKDIKYTETGMIRISSKYFSAYITKGYAAYLRWLINNDIIICDRIKKVGKAYGYLISPEMESPLIKVPIGKDKIITRRIIDNFNKKKKYHKKLPDHIKKMKSHFKNNMKINLNDALGWLEKQLKEKLISLNQYNVCFLSIHAINDGDIFFKINSTNGKIDSNLTNLKSELRQFIIGDFNHIDCQNSQPLIVNFITDFIIENNTKYYLKDNNSEGIINSTSLGDGVKKVLYNQLNSKELEYLRFFPDWNKKTVEEFTKFSGDTFEKDFYSSMQQDFQVSDQVALSRDDIKKLIYKVFFSKNQSFLKEKRIFKSLYPTIHKIIYNLKKHRHNKFAICLQRIESEIFIQTISKRLVENGIVPFTIHDSVMVIGEHKDAAIQIMKQVYMESIRKEPIFISKDI